MKLRPTILVFLGLPAMLLILVLHRSCRSTTPLEVRSSSTKQAPPKADSGRIAEAPRGTGAPRAAAASSPTSSSRAPEERAAPAPRPSEDGVIRGVVRLQAPEARSLGWARSCCARHPEGRPDESLMVGKDAGIRNALAYVVQSDAPGDPPPPVGMSIVDCRFEPRVVGVLALQYLEIRNGDDRAHDLLRGDLEGFSMEPGASTRMKYSGPRGPVRFGCRSHAWETGWAVVVPTPWFAVSGEGGEFLIEGIAPGERTLAIWHERLPGPVYRRVQVGGGPSVPVEILLSLPR